MGALALGPPLVVGAAEFFGPARQPLADAIARPYPLLSSRTKAWPMPASRTRSIEVSGSPSLTDDAALLPGLIAALEAGARVLVV